MPSMPSKPRLGAAPPPPLPPPPPPAVKKAPTPPPAPTPPKLTATGLAGAFMVELVMWNGAPYKDYWAYWVRSHVNSAVGVLIHAAGDVMNGFRFEIKRHHDFRITGNPPDKRIPLQWVDKSHFNEEAMFNGGLYKLDYTPVCGFEASAYEACRAHRGIQTAYTGKETYALCAESFRSRLGDEVWRRRTETNRYC